MPINPNAHIVSLRINVVAFRPLGNLLTTTVSMAIASAPPTPTGHVPVVKLDGSYHVIIGKRKPGNGADPIDEMNLRFLLPLAAYRFIGISFVGRNTKAGDESGQMTFPEVHIEPSGADHTMMIRNMRTPSPVAGRSTSFDYAIVIHNLERNELGIIDPEIENED